MPCTIQKILIEPNPTHYNHYSPVLYFLSISLNKFKDFLSIIFNLYNKSNDVFLRGNMCHIYYS